MPRKMPWDEYPQPTFPAQREQPTFPVQREMPQPGMGMEQPQQAEQKKPAFFGQGGVGRAIAGNIGDVLMQHNGFAPIYAPAMAQQQQAAAQMAAQQRQRSQGLADWKWKQDYQRDNPQPQAPDTFERTLMGAGIDPNSEQGRQLYQERAASMAGGEDEFVVVPIPGRGTYAGPKSGLPAAMGQPAGPRGKLTPMGGGTGNGVGGF